MENFFSPSSLSKNKNSIQWDTPIQYIKGVGPQLAELFHSRSIYTVENFINYFPRTYKDNRVIKKFSDITPGQLITFSSQIIKKNIIPLRNRRKSMYEIIIGDSINKISCKFFRVPFKGWFQSLNLGDFIEVKGTASYYQNHLEFHHPQIFPISDENNLQEEDLLIPIYTDIDGISQTKIKKLMSFILQNLYPIKEEIEWLPKWLKEKYNLIDLYKALKGIHEPDIKFIDDYLNFKTPFQSRLIFDEFFESQIYMTLKKQGWKIGRSYKIPPNQILIEKFQKTLPFELTQAQLKVINEIVADLNSSHPMHRLIQGDVGSGKTVVALTASLLTAKAGFQVAIMVPTEIVTEQHYQNAYKFLEPFGIKVEKLTGKMKEKEKRIVSGVLKSGFCNICIGTHALIQDNIEFNKLGLVIIDEQHRFGAHQRAKLKLKGRYPHFLVMTATPIPRTLSLALYGDLDISTIDELPKGRKPVITRKAFFNKRKEVFDFLKQQIEKGRQAYVVYPLVEESEKLDLKNAMEQYKKLKTYFSEFQWGLLTGRMSSEEKKNIMDQFRNNEIQALVSTTVIEVGVDVPNASLIIIEHGERFGLAQLHQLRGRIGRGMYQSYCIIVLGKAHSIESKERAYIMETTSDGFKIAEKDLELRGPGEFLGAKQSGILNFKFANIIRDQHMLHLTKQITSELISKDPKLLLKEHESIRKRFKKISEFINPG